MRATSPFSATGYIYRLMELQPLAAQMHRDDCGDRSGEPEILVLVAIEPSWGAQPQSEKPSYEWMNQTITRQFKIVGFADIISTERTEYHLPAAPGAQPTSSRSVLVDERR